MVGAISIIIVVLFLSLIAIRLFDMTLTYVVRCWLLLCSWLRDAYFSFGIIVVSVYFISKENHEKFSAIMIGASIIVSLVVASITMILRHGDCDIALIKWFLIITSVISNTILFGLILLELFAPYKNLFYHTVFGICGLIIAMCVQKATTVAWEESF